MICPPCKDGGTLNAAGLPQFAAALHEMCHSPNCPCQHKTGPDYINQEALST